MKRKNIQIKFCFSQKSVIIGFSQKFDSTSLDVDKPLRNIYSYLYDYSLKSCKFETKLTYHGHRRNVAASSTHHRLFGPHAAVAFGARRPVAVASSAAVVVVDGNGGRCGKRLPSDLTH